MKKCPVNEHAIPPEDPQPNPIPPAPGPAPGPIPQAPEPGDPVPQPRRVSESDGSLNITSSNSQINEETTGD